MPRALITGVTGQDGSYLAESLAEKGYQVFGLLRRTSGGPPEWIEKLHSEKRLHLVHGNVRDLSAVHNALQEAQPDEIYNLAAQSHVGVSFTCPDETWEINYHGLGRVVHEAMEQNSAVRIYQASTSEMFGSTPPPQNEQSPFAPVSPYAEAKLRAHEDYVVGYREKHGLYIASGILFNHESPRRGKHFVTRKITHSLAKIKLGLQSVLELGNLSALRDWGHAKEYVEAMRLILQQEHPEDFVIATGVHHSVRDFVTAAARALDMPVHWKGEGENEVGVREDGTVLVRVNPEFYRPREVQNLRGDASKAKKLLNWEPKIQLEALVQEMVKADYDSLARENRVA
jgi:GDPmannose 4,6-dehydratase